MDIRQQNYYRSGSLPFIFINEEFIQYPLNDNYMVSNYGRVYCKRGYMVTSFINRSGYEYCKIDCKNRAVHRLVAQTFNPILDDQKYDINHKDGNKLNNCSENLEWCTRSENIIHAFNNNLSKYGENHPNSIYSNEYIENICKMLEAGKNAKQISDELHISCDSAFRKLISKIIHRRLWKRISQKYNIDFK